MAAADAAPRSPSVILADLEHEAGIYSLLLELHRSGSEARLLPYSTDRVMAQIKLGTERKGGIIGVILDEDGKVIASVGLFLVPTWYSEAWTMAELWLYVREAARRDPANAAALFAFALQQHAAMKAQFEQLAAAEDRMSMPLIMELTHASGDRSEAKDRLWSRYARRIGSVFAVGP